MMTTARRSNRVWMKYKSRCIVTLESEDNVAEQTEQKSSQDSKLTIAVCFWG